jgi:hypothetical protein
MLKSFRFGAIHSSAEQAQAACGKNTHYQSGSVSEEREDGKQVFFSPMKNVNIEKEN